MERASVSRKSGRYEQEWKNQASSTAMLGKLCLTETLKQRMKRFFFTDVVPYMFIWSLDDDEITEADQAEE